MSTGTLTRTASVIDRIERLCLGSLDAAELLEVVGDELAAAVPHEALFLAATDPATLLGLGPGVVRNLPEQLTAPYWSYELEVPDFVKFTELAHASRPVADLHEATGGRPERSARWREFSRHEHLRAELRAVLRAGGRAWGILQLNRAEVDGAGFSDDEVALVAALGPIVARALRAATLRQATGSIGIAAPGVAVLDGQHRVVSATPEAVAWFDALQSYRRRGQQPGPAIPWEVIHAAQVAQRHALTGTARPARARLRTQCGSWVLVHAAPMAASTPDAVLTAVIVEPASASEVASIITEAYELTRRELDVTEALARGLSISETAAHLHLSRYTVQDHLKRIYDKVGVASRAELVAKVFTDHTHVARPAEQQAAA